MSVDGLISAKHYADPYFWECVMSAVSNPDFVEHWARLNDVEVPLAQIRDARTNKNSRRNWLVERFLNDVKEVIYDRVQRP